MTNDIFPLTTPNSILHNLSTVQLIERSVCLGEARLASTGALTAVTGEHTGRAANDKFTVRDDLTRETVWWDNNLAMSPDHFNRLMEDFEIHAGDRDLFVQDLYAGADQNHRLPVRVFSEYAWHSLFITHLLRRPEAGDLDKFTPQFTIVNLPSFRADPARHGTNSSTVIVADFSKRLVLIGGTSYAGEIKKSVFCYLNFVLPESNVLPMHCSANVGTDGQSSVFFGLSGTGKTTLSTEPNRALLGDDEHGWSRDGIFNFEGGCYAKAISLSNESEPEIFQASNRFGAVLENVVLNEESRAPNFFDNTLAENSRSAYPLSFLPGASPTSMSGHPKNVVMLAADAFGIMPPIARLTPSQAMYHFLSGYTAKVAGTEAGMGNEPKATFSTCFGAPFMPRHPSVYGNMLRRLIGEHEADCWLVNTGWTGGKYGTGHRMPLKTTRALLTSALTGELKHAPMRTDPVFGFDVPVALHGIDAAILDPRATWGDPAAYDAQAAALAKMFTDNFAKFEAYVDDDVTQAGPKLSRETAI